MANPIPSIFLAIPNTYPSLSVPGHYVQLMNDVSLARALDGLQNVPTAPELVVLNADTLFQSSLGALASLKALIARSGTTLLLVGDLSESLTAWVARATGAHAAVLGQLEPERFARIAELLLSERPSAAAATLHKEAAPQPSQRLDYLPVPA